MAPPIHDALSRKTGKEVAAVLVHKKKLLRIRNQLCSPLLRLSTEIIIHILSFILAGLDTFMHPFVWMSIYGACHRIHKIMRHAAELWWKVDCAHIRAAYFILLRSGGDPQVVLSDFRPERRLGVERILKYWKDKVGFKGHRLHTFEVYGSPSTFHHFSWILERPLPRIKSLKIHIGELIDEVDDSLAEAPRNHVPLELPVGMPLQVLDLRNVTLPWSSQSHIFNRLRELHLSFRDCNHTITIPEDELFGIFDASPQLEHLSLLQVPHQIPLIGNTRLPPKRILRLPNLLSLNLDNNPIVVKYTLEYMDIPVIDSLKIRSWIFWNATQAIINFLFPDDRLPARLFPNPPIFEVRQIGQEPEPTIGAEIGSVSLQLDFPFDEGELDRSSFMLLIFHLVPPSVTTLKFDYTNLEGRGWRDFFMLHPEVQFIECTEGYEAPVPKSLWDALSPPGGESADTPCPKLESIFITTYTYEVSYTSLSDCLRNRQIAGFTLRRLEILDHHGLMSALEMDVLHHEFYPLVGTVKVCNSFGSRSLVSPVQSCEPGYMLTGLQWGGKFVGHLLPSDGSGSLVWGSEGSDSEGWDEF